MEMNEIGSEFWLDDVTGERNSGVPEWTRRFGNTVLTSSGRGAISLLLQEVQPRPRSVLLPSYICSSVILPFITRGYTCHFYDINEDLTPDLESIAANQNVGMFLHMGYYGFPTNISLSAAIERLRVGSTLVVENVTHTLFSEYRRLGTNDYYVASMRKWIALPSGGFLASPNGAIGSSPGHDEAFSDTRSRAMLAKGRYMHGGHPGLKPQYLDLFAQAEAILDADVKPYSIDGMSRTILSFLDVNALREKRRANFEILSEGLGDVGYLQPVFARLPENVCPLFFPVYIDKRRGEIRQKLTETNIYCPIHWSAPEQIRIGGFENARKIYDTELSIPCDQRYGVDDMQRVVSVLRGL